MGTRSARVRAVLAALLITVVGCGDPAPSRSATSATPAIAQSTARTAVTPLPTLPASPTPISTDGPGASPSYDPALGRQACELIDVETVATVLGVAGLTSRGVSGDADTGICSYSAGGRTVALVPLSVSGGVVDLAVYASESVSVPDLGDSAIWVDSIGVLLIRVGDRAVGIQVLMPTVPPDEIQAKSIILGRAAIDRL